MSGDKTRLVALERLDLEDVDSLQDLLYAYSDLALGMIMGYGGGALSPFKQTLSNNGVTWWVTIGSFAFYHAERLLSDDAGVTYKAWKGRIVLHDQTKADNVPAQSKINYTAAKAAAEAAFAGAGLDPFNTALAYPFIWARPIYVNADTAARRQWSVGAGQEQSVALETRKRVRVEFSLGVSNTAAPAPDGGYGWISVGKIVDWTGNMGAMVPTIQALAPWDDPETWQNTASAGTWFDNGQNASAGAQNNVSIGTILDSLQSGALIPDGGGFQALGKDRSFGLIQILHLMREATRKVGGTVDGWFHPSADARGAQDDATLALNQNAAQDALLNPLTTVARPVFTAVFWRGGASYLVRSYPGSNTLGTVVVDNISTVVGNATVHVDTGILKIDLTFATAQVSCQVVPGDYGNVGGRMAVSRSVDGKTFSIQSWISGAAHGNADVAVFYNHFSVTVFGAGA